MPGNIQNRTTGGTSKACLALLCAGLVWPSASLFGQAAAGPLPPAEPQAPSQPAPPPKPEKKLPVRTTLAGFWKLNTDQSDDPQKKIEDARRAGGRIGGGGGPQSGGGGPQSGGGGPMGGGYPFPGRGPGPWGGGGRRPSEADEENGQLLAAAVRAADSLTIALKDPEIDLTDNQGSKLVFYTDGRKVQKSKDSNVQEISAHWKGNQLITDERTPQGKKMSRTLELSTNGQQLFEIWHIETSHSESSLSIWYSYDAATQASQ